MFRRRRAAADPPAMLAADGAGSSLRASLLGEVPLELWGAEEASEPWATFVRARAALAQGSPSDAIGLWRSIVSTEGYESRHYVQAWQFLRAHGERPDDDLAKRVYGVVIEHWVASGFDRVGAYADRHARYFNYSGAGVVWERPDPSLDGRVDEVISAAQEIVGLLGPWERPQPPPPPGPGDLRLNILTPSGLHFGNGPVDAMYKQALAGRVLAGGLALMQALIDVAKPG